MNRSFCFCLANVLLAIAAACSLAACQSVETYEKHLALVGTQSIKVQAPREGVRYSAVIKPSSQVDLAFRVGGYINQIHMVSNGHGGKRLVQSGDAVKKGTLLARVRQGDYAARTRQCQAAIAESRATQRQSRSRLAECLASLEEAQLNFDRGRILWDSNSLTKPDYDALKAKLEVSQSRVEEARARILVDKATESRLGAQFDEARLTLADCSLTAPSDCLVLKRNIEEGSLVTSGSVAYVVADTSSVKAAFGVPDVMLKELFAGQQLNVFTESLPGCKFPGRVSSISPEADPKSRVFEVEVTIPNPLLKLKIGMIASLTVQPGVVRAPAMSVPLSSVVRSSQNANGYAVFVVEEKDGKFWARQRNVALGESFGNMIAVTKGLSLGDRVVTSGSARIADGEQVNISP